jgi:hypothetical protein
MTTNGLLKRVVDDLNLAYTEYLQAKKLPDIPVTRIGFFAAAENFVSDEPLPDGLLQHDVLSYIRTQQARAIVDCVEEIEFMFTEVNNRTQKSVPLN